MALPTNYNDLNTEQKTVHLLEELISLSGGTTDPVVETPTRSIPVSAGSVAAGVKSVTVFNTGANDALLLGVVLGAGRDRTLSATPGSTLGAISYDPQTSTLEILEIR